jgi:acyl carrier protein
MHPNVHTAVVILSAATCHLESYIIAKGGVTIGANDLRVNLQRLPIYMHPEIYHFITVQQLSRMPSGKINPKGLQHLSAYFVARAQDELDEKRDGISDILYDASELGQLLRSMREILSQAVEITATSDFFEDLGGHSLTAAMLVSKLRQNSPKESLLSCIGLQDIYIH